MNLLICKPLYPQMPLHSWDFFSLSSEDTTQYPVEAAGFPNTMLQNQSSDQDYLQTQQNA